MEDLTSKITELLNNPESLNQLKGLSGLLSQNLESMQNSDNNKFQEKSDSQEIPSEALNMVMKIMPVLSSMKKDDNSTRLLLALKPLLSLERQKKVDQSIRMLQMMRVMLLMKNKELLT